MDEQILNPDAALAQAHHFELDHAGLEPDAPLFPFLAEDKGLGVLEVDLGVVGHFLFGEVVEGAVVIDDAVLENLDERGAAVFMGALQHHRQVPLHGVDRTGGEAGAGAEREGHRRDRVVDRAHRRRRRHRPHPRGRRILSLGQPIGLVIEQQDLQIDIAAQHVQHMIAADRQPVAVTGDDPDAQVRIGQLDPGGDRRGPPMDGVEAVTRDVIGKAGRTADPGDEDDIGLGDGDIGQGLIDRLENGVITAAGAPAHLLIGCEVLRRQIWFHCLDGQLTLPGGGGSPPQSR